MKYICDQCGDEFEGPGALSLHLISGHDASPATALGQAQGGARLSPEPVRKFYPAETVWSLLDWCSRRAESNRVWGLPVKQFQEVLDKAHELGLTREGT